MLSKTKEFGAFLISGLEIVSKWTWTLHFWSISGFRAGNLKFVKVIENINLEAFVAPEPDPKSPNSQKTIVLENSGFRGRKFVQICQNCLVWSNSSFRLRSLSKYHKNDGFEAFVLSGPEIVAKWTQLVHFWSISGFRAGESELCIKVTENNSWEAFVAPEPEKESPNDQKR